MSDPKGSATLSNRVKSSAASAAQPLGTASDGSEVIHVQNEDELRLAQMGVLAQFLSYGVWG